MRAGWLKWQANPKHPLYGQRGRDSDDFRKRHWHAHRHNNLTVPTHVPWAGGVMGVVVDRSVTWETGADGSILRCLPGYRSITAQSSKHGNNFKQSNC